MRRSVIVGIVSAMLVAGVVIAAQGWTDDQDGDNFSLANVSSVQVNSLAGTGTSCLQTDNNGLVSSTGTPCGAGLGGSSGGTVTVVTGSDPIFITGAPTVNPNVTIQGAIVSGSTSTTKQNIGTNASGVMEQTTSSGIATLGTYQATPGAVQFGSTSGGGLAQDDPNFHWDAADAALGIDTNTPLAGTGIHVDKSTNSIYTPVFMTNSNGGTLAAVGFRVGLDPTNISTKDTTITVFGAGATAYGGIYAAGNVVWESGPNLNDVVMSQYGTHDFIWTTTTSQTERWRLQSAGNLRTLAMTAPATPAAGYGAFYENSTSKNMEFINDAGTVNHGAQTQTAAAGKAFTALSAAGAFAETSFQAPLSSADGTLVFPTSTTIRRAAITGDTAIGAGSNVSVTSALTDAAGAGSSHATTGSWGANQLLQTDAGGSIKAAGAACSMLPALTGGATSSAGSCATTVNFSGLTGSASCGQLPALTGAVTSSAGSCATAYAGMPASTQVAVGAGATSAPTGSANLTFSAGNLSISNTAKLSGVTVSSMLSTDSGHFVQAAAVGTGLSFTSNTLAPTWVPKLTLPYYFTNGFLAFPAGGSWLLMGGFSTTSTSPIEWGVNAPVAPTNISLNVEVIVQTLVNAGGTCNVSFIATKNGSGVGGTNITESATGHYNVTVTGQTIAVTDTFGVFMSTSAFCNGGASSLTITANLGVY